MSGEHHEQRDNEPFGSDIPELEDASEPESHGEVVADDENELELDAAARSLDGDGSDTAQDAFEQVAEGDSILPANDDDLSDVAHIPDPPVTAPGAHRSRRAGDWEYEMSAHSVVVELKRIENEVRATLEGVDSKRKRRLGGTQRWHELEDDILFWWHCGRVPEQSLRRLQELIARRHYLFDRLRFLASTRPVMNS